MKTLNILLNFCFFYRQFLLLRLLRLYHSKNSTIALSMDVASNPKFHHGELLYVVGRQLGRNMNES